MNHLIGSIVLGSIIGVILLLMKPPVGGLSWKKFFTIFLVLTCIILAG